MLGQRVNITTVHGVLILEVGSLSTTVVNEYGYY